MLKTLKTLLKKLLELISRFSKVAEYKINAQTSVAFLYTNVMNDQKEKLRKQSHFVIASKK